MQDAVTLTKREVVRLQAKAESLLDSLNGLLAISDGGVTRPKVVKAKRPKRPTGPPSVTD